VSTHPDEAAREEIAQLAWEAGPPVVAPTYRERLDRWLRTMWGNDYEYIVDLANERAGLRAFADHLDGGEAP